LRIFIVVARLLNWVFLARYGEKANISLREGQEGLREYPAAVPAFFKGVMLLVFRGRQQLPAVLAAVSHTARSSGACNKGTAVSDWKKNGEQGRMATLRWKGVAIQQRQRERQQHFFHLKLQALWKEIPVVYGMKLSLLPWEWVMQPHLSWARPKEFSGGDCSTCCVWH
jgi:hypothetical protein